MPGHWLLPLVPRPPASLPSSSISQSLMLVPGVTARVQGCTEQESRGTEAPPPPLSGLASLCFSVSASCWGSDQAATSCFSQLPDLAPLLSTKAGNGVGGLAWLLEPSAPSALGASPPPVSEAPATAVLVQWACVRMDIFLVMFLVLGCFTIFHINEPLLCQYSIIQVC